LKVKGPHPKPGLLKEWESAVGEAKAALLKEWDEHLHAAHPLQWEREQKKRARWRAAQEPFNQDQGGTESKTSQKTSRMR
jgi:hypothetical protein